MHFWNTGLSRRLCEWTHIMYDLWGLMFFQLTGSPAEVSIWAPSAWLHEAQGIHLFDHSPQEELGGSGSDNQADMAIHSCASF